MREVQLRVYFQPVAITDAERGRAPFANPVHGEHGRPIEGRGEERACRVRLMMLGEKQRFLPAAAAGQLAKLVPKSGLLEHLFLDPQRNGHAEGVEAARRSEEHTSELQSLMRISYAVFCLKKQQNNSASYNHKD